MFVRTVWVGGWVRWVCAHSDHTSIITLKVSSRDFPSMIGFQQLYKLLPAKATDRANFEHTIIRHVGSSYNIWCKGTMCN